MYFGNTDFYCSECKGTFVGPMIEWQCTCLCQPLKCPHCGSMHTRPGKGNNIIMNMQMDRLYENLWEQIDKGTQGGNSCFIPLSDLKSQTKKEEEKESLWDKIILVVYSPFFLVSALNELLPLWLKITLAVILLGIIALIIF